MGSLLLQAATRRAKLTLSVTEVYNESIRDLLSAQPPSEAVVSIGGRLHDAAITEQIDDAAHAAQLLSAAAARRVTAHNGLNEVSSRSHLIMLYQASGRALV